MRINKFVAQASGLSRRAADAAIEQGKVTINGGQADIGQTVSDNDEVRLDGELLHLATETTTIMINKPAGYVCSRNGQGSKTIYDLLPDEFQALKPVGRLDKYSSGLLLLTNDGELAHKLTHPSFQKEKVYQVALNKPLAEPDKIAIEKGVELDDGLSALQLAGEGREWTVTMHEGRNRQIRRTFENLGYNVTKLHRTKFGSYKLDDTAMSDFKSV